MKHRMKKRNTEGTNGSMEQDYTSDSAGVIKNEERPATMNSWCYGSNSCSKFSGNIVPTSKMDIEWRSLLTHSLRSKDTPVVPYRPYIV